MQQNITIRPKQSYEETQVYSAFKDMYDEAFRAEEASLKAANGWQSRVYGNNGGIAIQV